MQATVNNPGFRVIGFIGFRDTSIVWYTIVYWEYLIFGGVGVLVLMGGSSRLVWSFGIVLNIFSEYLYEKIVDCSSCEKLRK